MPVVFVKKRDTHIRQAFSFSSRLSVRCVQVYRDYKATSSTKFLANMWPIILHVMQVTLLPESSFLATQQSQSESIPSTHSRLRTIYSKPLYDLLGNKASAQNLRIAYILCENLVCSGWRRLTGTAMG
jgi:hypothetical protein